MPTLVRYIMCGCFVLGCFIVAINRPYLDASHNLSFCRKFSEYCLDTHFGEPKSAAVLPQLFLT